MANRYDFRGADAEIGQSEKVLALHADSDFKLNQLLDILRMKLIKRGIEVSCLEVRQPLGNGKMRKQDVLIREDVDKDLSRKIVKLIKTATLKCRW